MDSPPLGNNASGGRKRWIERRVVREPDGYHSFLKEEMVAQHPTSSRRNSTPLHAYGGTMPTAVASSSTIRAVSPEAAPHAGEAAVEMDPEPVTDLRASSFEQAFIPHTTTTITGGPALGGNKSKQQRRLVKEKEKEREVNGSGGTTGMLGRATSTSRNDSSSNRSTSRHSSSNGNNPRKNNRPHVGVDLGDTSRPRTRTLDQFQRDHSPKNTLRSSRNRIGSVNMPSSGAEYLASVPATTSPPPAPSVRSLGSPPQAFEEPAVRRSRSPDSSHTGDSMMSKSSASRRILHLTNVLKGRMSGNVVLRRDRDSPWTELYCFIKEDSGRLMYEPRGGDGADRTLVQGLKGCDVKPNVDGESPYLEVTLPDSDTEIHFKLLTQSDFDSWFAALLWWSYLDSTSTAHELAGREVRPSTSATPVAEKRPEPPLRTSSMTVSRDRASSSRSDRRSSVIIPKEAPVIKIGKMIFWDTNVGYSNSTSTNSNVGQPNTGRPGTQRMHSYRSRRWRRISAQLRENGELKLHADADNTLISVVQLSQLSRCAIQRLDPSVLDHEFCIGVYPQYTSTNVGNQPGLIRPIFLSLESRVLFEVWFVLLRAFTIPQLYGPPNQRPESEEDNGELGVATSTTDMFRVERTLNFRIVEAKLYPPAATPDAGGHGKTAQGLNTKPDQHGYYAEVLLDDETRGRTSVKFDGPSPLWGESFEFMDLPAVLSSVSVVVKKRTPDFANSRDQQESRLIHETHGYTPDQHGGFTGLTFDATCGQVEVYLHELEGDKEVEKWWPIVNIYNQRVGEVLLKTRMNEGIILMEKDYQPLSGLLHRFTNGLTLQIAQMVPSELKRVSDCLLNIYQVSGKAGDWIMALIEEEIDGIHKETPISRLRYSRRVGSDSSHDNLGTGAANSDRELIVRDMNKNAALEANLLFRGNTLLTKSLDTHMRRVGKEYLEESLASMMNEINERELDCEVDPNRVSSSGDLERNWKRLLTCAQDVWNAIVATKHRCPVELRVIFRHIRACAEDRYGDFLRSVSYSSVSGFLFLRFFCPAILNPKLFGLLREDVKPRARRTFTLLAKSLQTLSNMASFGAKEVWMEPMNAFLTQNRESFKSFVDEICYVPTPLTAAVQQSSVGASSAYATGVVSAETNLSYTTPMTIMQRLPPTSREGFPSLPYLIDQARGFAELVQLWLDATTAMSEEVETTAGRAKSHAEVMAAIQASEGDLMAFHEICTDLAKRKQECLSRAERAERPNSSLSFRWDELIDQLQPNGSQEAGDDMPILQPSEIPTTLAERVASDASIIPPPSQLWQGRSREWDVVPDDDEEELATRLYDTTPSNSASRTTTEAATPADRPGSSGIVSSLRDSLRRAQVQSRASDSRTHSMTASASASNVSSDTEHSVGTTALPNYERERRHRERRDAAKQQIKQEVEAARQRENQQKDRRKVRTPIVSALRKKKERDNRSQGAAPEGG